MGKGYFRNDHSNNRNCLDCKKSHIIIKLDQIVRITYLHVSAYNLKYNF